jgi:hypothetical protein
MRTSLLTERSRVMTALTFDVRAIRPEIEACAHPIFMGWLPGRHINECDTAARWHVA